jgi:hypothetical protein
VALEKQFDGLRLEVGRMIHLLKHENLIHSQSKPRIFSAGELPTLPGSMGATVDRSKRSREEVSPNGMSDHPLPQSHGLEQLSESHHARGVDSYGDVVRASHAQLPKLNSLCFRVLRLNSGNHVVRTTLRCMGWNLRCGLRCLRCIWRGLLGDGFSRWNGRYAMCSG